MIAVDTNIIVRFLTHDDEKQYKKALSIFTNEDVFVTDTVILETEWILRFAYNFTSEEICNALTKFFGLKNVYISNSAIVAEAILWHQKGLDFSDAFHLAHSQEYEKLYTFDKKFSKKARGLSDCAVVLP